jgi:hypothetical protein
MGRVSCSLPTSKSSPDVLSRLALRPGEKALPTFSARSQVPEGQLGFFHSWTSSTCLAVTGGSSQTVHLSVFTVLRTFVFFGGVS